MEKITGVKYMRDFYPDEMRVRAWIEGHWRRASLRAGFAEWDAPIMEYLELFTRKSGEEIVGQLYTLTDQGDRRLAIRPEMTPSLARMIAHRQAALPRPVKWFCMARMCRYERGQRGRLREFWQWNADVLGLADPVADAEVIAVALDALESMGLSAEDVEVRLNSRTLLAALLGGIGVPESRQAEVYAVADKRGKLDAAALTELYAKLGLSADVLAKLTQLMDCSSLTEVEGFVSAHRVVGHEAPLANLQSLFQHLDDLGRKQYCRFDIGVVRGLAYYTGPVFEIFDRRAELRAIAGGGRYDNLLSVMGGQSMPAVGFGMGDVVLTELLKELGKLPVCESLLDYYVIPLSAVRRPDALRLVAKIRGRGLRADFAAAPGNLGKAMKRADAAAAAAVVLVGGSEWEAGRLKIRDMRDGGETEVDFADFLKENR